MSANNCIRISKYTNPKKYVVVEADAETDHGSMIGQFDTIEQALEFSNEYMRQNVVEYGIVSVEA